MNFVVLYLAQCAAAIDGADCDCIRTRVPVIMALESDGFTRGSGWFFAHGNTSFHTQRQTKGPFDIDPADRHGGLSLRPTAPHRPADRHGGLSLRPTGPAVAPRTGAGACPYAQPGPPSPRGQARGPVPTPNRARRRPADRRGGLSLRPTGPPAAPRTGAGACPYAQPGRRGQARGPVPTPNRTPSPRGQARGPVPTPNRVAADRHGGLSLRPTGSPRTGTGACP